MNIDSGSSFSISKDILAREFDGEVVILNMHDESYYSLEAVGVRFWELIKEGQTFGRIIETLLNEYETTEEELSADLKALTSDMLKRKILTLSQNVA